VIVVSEDPNLFDSVRSTLRPDVRFIDADNGVHCDGSVAPRTKIYPVKMTPAEWAGWESGDSQMPDPRLLSALIFECQSPTWIAEVGTFLAESLDTSVWFVDSADVAWPADQVDPGRIALS
jgi:hypothetical protein